MYRVSIIGAGVVGTALGYLLKKSGYPIVGIASRTIDSAKKAIDFIGEGEASTNLKNTAKKAEIVFIATSDGAIKGVCKKVASEGGFRRGSIVFHMSGALPSKVLSSARRCWISYCINSSASEPRRCERSGYQPPGFLLLYRRR